MLRQCLRWIRAQIVKKAEHFLLRVLSTGPVPQHVAFVMDGNRRYARRNQQAIVQGHTDGFAALRKLLETCLRLHIRCVSVYAFAIDNFKRSPEEVEHLMNLAHEKLLEMAQHGQILEEYGVRLNVLGKTALLPDYVQESIREAESLTRKNNKAILNICMPYASQDEITTAVQSAVRKSLESDSEDCELTEDDISAQLMTTLAGSPPLEILVRTSGVKRLSDYLLWQCSENTQIHFCNKYWPEFGLFDFIPILLDYQRKIWRQRLS
ncbi:Decaprenyl diphosphate synthase-like protein [Roridomyces roridus]|uniref:Alkyl transferase n=1 Tax=Roridomyces roridus TaxID=1738132 RepID=A0AAD7B6J8_9AGAR|nr:Decaprenyl diphosphate synthase-like protein [Roridomyces roridus]